MQASIPQPWDHDLSRNQELDAQPTEPPGRPNHGYSKFLLFQNRCFMRVRFWCLSWHFRLCFPCLLAWPVIFLLKARPVMLGSRYWVTQTVSTKIYTSICLEVGLYLRFAVAIGTKDFTFLYYFVFISSWHWGFLFTVSQRKAMPFYSSSSFLLLFW